MDKTSLGLSFLVDGTFPAWLLELQAEVFLGKASLDENKEHLKANLGP